MAKSCVAPLKPVTIPRLELTATLVSVKISAILQRELEYDQITEVFWTDSKVVIGYISNDARRFHIFIANRVQQIRDHTSPRQWKYVETDLNPADDASCGLYAKDLIKNSRWWNGPDFLWKPLEIQSSVGGAEPTCLAPDDPELKKISAMTTQAKECLSLPERLKYFSSWHRAKRAVAACLCLQKRYHTRLREQNQMKAEDLCNNVPKGRPKAHVLESKQARTNHYIPVNTKELQEAETEIVKSVQREAFQEEISLLSSMST